MVIQQEEHTIIAIITELGVNFLAWIVGGLSVIGMKSATPQVLSLGTIMLNVSKSVLNMVQKKTNGLNATTLTPKTKTTGYATGKILTAWRLLEMHVGSS